jgi:hypothetical protein
VTSCRSAKDELAKVARQAAPSRSSSRKRRQPPVLRPAAKLEVDR